MTFPVQTSSKATRSWSSSPLIVSRDSFSHQTCARFQTGGAKPVLFGCHYIYTSDVALWTTQRTLKLNLSFKIKASEKKNQCIHILHCENDKRISSSWTWFILISISSWMTNYGHSDEVPFRSVVYFSVVWKEKVRDLTQSYDRSLYTDRKIQKAIWKHENAIKYFVYTTIADRLRKVTLGNGRHPTGVVKPVNGIPILPLTTTVV